MQLTHLQLQAIRDCAKAERRTESQMLSLLLAEGIRFYFFDNPPRFGDMPEMTALGEALDAEASTTVGLES
jgi:hypothetical protein